MVQGYIRARLWPSCFVTPKLECASLRTHAQLRATCGVLWRAWSDGVVPLRVELVALDIEARHLLVANLDPLRIAPRVQHAVHCQPAPSSWSRQSDPRRPHG